MRGEDIRTLLDETPFRPSTIHLANGRSLFVTHPESILLMRSNRAMTVSMPQTVHHLDLMLVVEIERSRHDDIDPLASSEHDVPRA